MNATQFSTLLDQLDACSEAREWALGKSLKVVWKTCKRGDWLLWLCGKMANKPGWPTHKEIVLAACDCAETALKFVPKGEDRPRQCLEAVRAWAHGKATLVQVREAANAANASAASAADAAYAADAAAASAVYAAANAANAANAAAYAYAAKAAANAAAYAYAAASAASAASAAANAAARTKSLRKSASLVRSLLKEPNVRA